MLGRVKFGIWEYFDENGILTEAVDEDQKFGKIKPYDVVAIMEKEKIINREEGTSVTKWNKKYNITGEFYASVIGSIIITFEPASKEIITGNEVAPLWKITYFTSSQLCACEIDGETGFFKKEWGTRRLRR